MFYCPIKLLSLWLNNNNLDLSLWKTTYSLAPFRLKNSAAKEKFTIHNLSYKKYYVGRDCVHFVYSFERVNYFIFYYLVQW